MRRLILAALLASPPTLAATQDRPPRILVGFAAGGTGDLVARLIAEGAAPAPGVRPVVGNCIGARGFIAAEAAGRSPAGGSVLLQRPMAP